MCRLLVLAFLGLVRCCGGFVVPSNARRWSGNAGVTTATTIADADRPRGVPSQQRPGVVRMSVKDMIGADVETGGLFDPLGFSKDEPSLFRRRAVELKHGRVAMVAMTGILVQSFVRFPGFPPFDVSNPGRPLAVFERLCSLETQSVLLALLAIGLFELTVGKQDYVDRAPGELGDFGAFAKPVDEVEWEKVQMAELKHGRLAMVAVLGSLVQEVVTGEGPVEQLFSGKINPFV